MSDSDAQMPLRHNFEVLRRDCGCWECDAAIRNIQAYLQTWEMAGQAHVAQKDALRAEVERLRAALTKIADVTGCVDFSHEVARSALDRSVR